ncbi:MAG: proprotein convertase P-domain-containing protein, partial [Bacteroidia bacterium]|nr:proprotein convertase P-domain-containing protein [Bacteroidia bacterium]
MHKIYLLILLCSGALTVITVNSEELLQSESNSPVLFSSMNCTGFSASILSDTVYNCPANTHIYTIDTSANFVYQWIGPTGYISSNWEIFVTQRGIYGLTVVDTVNNCTATDSIYVRQLPCEDLSSEWIPPGIDITVYLDTIAPTFTTPADTTVFTDQLCVASTSSASIGTVIDETDDCDTNLDVTFQDSISNDCSGSITIYRTWSVEDDCGNLSTGEQTIFVRDTIGPSIAVPSDIMVYVDNVCFADTSASTTGNYLTVSDGCDASISTASYTDVRIDICAGSYDIIRTWSAIDDCGNTGTATQVISVVDSTSPQLIIPPDTTITASGIPNNASASDYCSVTPFLTYSDSISTVGCQRQVFRTWTAIDDCGNTSSGVQNIFYDQSFTANLTVSEYNGQPLSCTGSSDGELTANVAGGVSPISYVWSSGHTNATISGLDTGYYSVTITDSNGCSDSLSITLTAPNPIQITFNTNDPLCVQASNGAIDASISGGTSPYTYLWLHDSTSVEDINNLSAATYILEVTDVNGCQATDSTILQNPLPFSIDVVLTSDYNGYTTSCNGSSDASASINLTNNSGAVTYLWSNGQTSSVLSNVASGTYTITATDSNGCEAIDSISIADNPGITTSISITSDYNGSPVSCYNSSDGSAEVSATGGESPYTYLWSNGSTSNTVTSVDTGTYLVTVTDFNGCQGIDTLVIDFVNNVLVDISINSDYQGNALSCRDASDASISVEVTNGLGPYTYLWSNGSTQDSIFGLAAGVYNLTVTDANGCQTVDFITIPNPPPLQVDLTTNLLNCGIDDGQILITATGGSGMYEYSLDSTNWQLNNVFDSLPPGGHMVYVRDVSQGCSATPSVVILSTTSAPGIENLTAIHPTGPGLTDGSIMIDVVGIGLPVEYRLSGLTGWQPSNIFQGLGEGTYNTEIRYVGQTCADSASITLIASGGITTIDSTSNVCSDELSNIQNLEVYYLPVAEDHILQALQTITPVGCANIYSVDPIHNYIYIGVVESGTVVTYDHWEDGFETNFDFSIQPTTEIWGDGNPNNGMPPGYNLDILQAGDKIFLNNPVVSTTRATVLDYDAGDRISSRGSISITRLGWATGSSTLFAGAVEVHKTDAWGQNYSIPVGQNTDVNSMFVYTGFTIMAAQNNTTIQIDADNNAVLDAVITLNEGESYLYNGGVYSGGKISASSPVQIHLLTGDDCSNYESRWFTLSPEENWDNGYYVPVSTLNNGAPTTNGINKPTYVHLYNPHAYDISVVWRTDSGIQDTLNIAGEQTAYQEIPEGTGAHFGSDDNFYAIATIDSDPGNNTANDWGFALLPERLLSPQIYLTGFAPGQNPAFTCDIGIEIDPLNYTIDSISSEELISINGQIQNAFDNDLTTAWFSEYSSFTNDHPHEIVLDLGQNYNVSGFKHINALSALYVDTFLNPNPPFVLPNNTLFDTISAFAITDQHSIIDLNVHIDINHTKINDLTLTLESPSGTRVLLVDDQCTTAMDLKTTFDNEASDLLDCANTTVGYYIPKERLSAFYGEFTAGVWQLHIEDDNGILGGGLLNSWSLEITHGVSTNGAISEFEFYVSDDGINWGVPV